MCETTQLIERQPATMREILDMIATCQRIERRVAEMRRALQEHHAEEGDRERVRYA